MGVAGCRRSNQSTSVGWRNWMLQAKPVAEPIWSTLSCQLSSMDDWLTTSWRLISDRFEWLLAIGRCLALAKNERLVADGSPTCCRPFSEHLQPQQAVCSATGCRSVGYQSLIGHQLVASHMTTVI